MVRRRQSALPVTVLTLLVAGVAVAWFLPIGISNASNQAFTRVPWVNQVDGNSRSSLLCHAFVDDMESWRNQLPMGKLVNANSTGLPYFFEQSAEGSVGKKADVSEVDQFQQRPLPEVESPSDSVQSRPPQRDVKTALANMDISLKSVIIKMNPWSDRGRCLAMMLQTRATKGGTEWALAAEAQGQTKADVVRGMWSMISGKKSSLPPVSEELLRSLEGDRSADAVEQPDVLYKSEAHDAFGTKFMLGVFKSQQDALHAFDVWSSAYEKVVAKQRVQIQALLARQTASRSHQANVRQNRIFQRAVAARRADSDDAREI